MIDTYEDCSLKYGETSAKGSISLKDSDKVSTYLDKAIDMFPKIESRGWEVQQKAMRIEQNQNRKAFNSIKSLDDLIERI